MKVICDRPALLDAVNVVSSVVASRTPTPVLLCIKMTARNGLLTLASTDLEVGLTISISQVEVQEEGEVLIPADKVVQIVRASDEPTLVFDARDSAVHIRGADSHFQVYGQSPSDAPVIRTFEDSKLDCEIEAGVLQRLINRTLFAAASEHSRYAINGVLFDRDGKKLRMVATDGRRLAVATGNCLKGAGKSTCIIPTKALSIITKLIDNPEDTVQIAVEESQVLVNVQGRFDSAQLTSNLVEGAFPPFEDVIKPTSMRR